MAQQPCRVPGTLGDLAGLRRQRAGPPYEGPAAGGLDECGHFDAGRGEAGGHGEEKRAGPGDHGGAAGDRERALEHGLGASRGDDTGEGPAGERQHLLVSARRQKHGVGAHVARVLLLGAEERVHGEAVGAPLGAPHVTVRQVPYGVRPDMGVQRFGEPLPGAPLVVQGLGAAGAQSGGGLSVELPTGLGGRVEQRDPYTVRSGRDARREAGRAGADHRQVRAGLLPIRVSHRGPSPPGCGWRRPAAGAPGRPAGSACR